MVNLDRLTKQEIYAINSQNIYICSVIPICIHSVQTLGQGLVFGGWMECWKMAIMQANTPPKKRREIQHAFHPTAFLSMTMSLALIDDTRMPI